MRWTPFGSTLLSNEVVAHAYASAKINLNMHRSQGQPSDWDRVITPAKTKDAGASVNPRVMEIAACGGFLLTDHRPGLDEIFGKVTVPLFDSEVPGDLERQIRWWLAHDGERQRVAQDMCKAVSDVMHHDTFDARVRVLDAEVDKRLSAQAVA